MSTPSRPADAEDDPGWLLKDLVAANHEVAQRLARDVGLGLTDFRALDLLLGRGPTGPNELGRRLGMTSPAVTALADRLEAAGHVERVRDPQDRRRLALVPTQHARDEAWRVLTPFVRDIAEASADLTPEERAVVARYLRRVLEIQRKHASDV